MPGLVDVAKWHAYIIQAFAYIVHIALLLTVKQQY